MHIVGIDIADREETHVHTIDMWFSKQRGLWMVERLNADGDVVGNVYHGKSEHDARMCLEDWLRAHTETHLVTPQHAKSAAMTIGKAPAKDKRRAA